MSVQDVDEEQDKSYWQSFKTQIGVGTPVNLRRRSVSERQSLLGPGRTQSYTEVPAQTTQAVTTSASVPPPTLASSPPAPTPASTTPPAPAPAAQRSLVDLLIVLFILLLSESARGIVLPTLVLYVGSVGGDATWLGWTVGAFSTGRFVSTIGLGYISTQSAYKRVLAVSVLICVIGNALYATSYAGGIIMLLISRFLIGFGAGTLSVIRAYVVQVTSSAERTAYMAVVGAVQFLGFAIMPGAGSLLTWIPYFEVFGLHMNPFTTPGWTLAIANLIALVLLLVKFKEPVVIPPPSAPLASVDVKTDATPVKAAKPKVKYTRQAIIAFVVFITLNFLVRAVLSIVETLGTPIFRKLHPDPTDTADGPTHQNVALTGYLFAGFGLVGIVVLLFIGFITRRGVPDFAVMFAGLIALCVGTAVLMGDNISLTQFIIGCGIIWSIGFPLAQTVIVSMFSKSVGPGPQGTMMGWIGAAGSLGRVVGPIIAGYLYAHVSQTATFGFGLGASVLSMIISLAIAPAVVREVKRLVARKKGVIHTMNDHPYEVPSGGAGR
eukprot:TRINITY_DN9195_c0_g1_i4.p1 TRINITY_DN9195_c0_g1~~TRINITY_DN9195_c0_g1_i4.p1  ORF type:complete len:550 (+),score=103.44 TRINITY_DN9195_c0_g1_i4:84-1733(+)